MNSYVRFKRGATEENPSVEVYDEKLWAETEESRTGNIEMSLALLAALHQRWTLWLRSLNDEDWARTFVHPDWGEITLEMNLQIYAFHCRHHLAHITRLKDREGWK